jgi:diguanylate cyclase (GGDEF)-like protein
MEKGSGWYRINGKIVTDISNALENSSIEEAFSKSMDLMAVQIREIIPSHQSAVSYVPRGDFCKAMHTTSFTEKYAKYRDYDVLPTGEGIWAVIFEKKQTMCLTEAELKRHPRFKNFSNRCTAKGLEHPPLPGWLAVPILSKDGQVIGMLQLSDKKKGDYDSEDIKTLERYAVIISHAFEIHYQDEKILENSKQINDLDKLVHLDHLTQINNRLSFDLKVNEAFQASMQLGGNMTLLIIDLDSFKAVNDTLGHSVGDQLLLQATERIQSVLAEGDYLARLGGDEFAVILSGYHSGTGVAEHLVKVFNEPFLVQDHEILSTITVGVADAISAKSPEQLLQNADMALYRAKKDGKNGFNLYESELDERRRRQLVIETHIRAARKANEFFLNYQPIFELKTQKVACLEALIRWDSSELGAVYPDEFIPIAEQSGKVYEVTHWVISKVFDDLARWLAKGYLVAPVTINISTNDLLSSDMLHLIQRKQLQKKVPLSLVKLELTETLALAQNAVTQENLTQLDQIGVDVIIDDFGTGYSSLSKLTHLPVKYLKTDKSFMLNFEHLGNRKIIESVNAISNAFDFDVIIEGIETAAHLDFAIRTGAKYGQGYHLCRPKVALHIEDLYL